MEEFDCHISDTAFLVNESRARKPLVSRDRYARAWVPPASRDRVHRLWDEFSINVYPHDDLELSIRNRFFLERINRFMEEHRNAVFINLGAGLTSYPFLMYRETESYEIDLAHVVQFKQRRVAQLIESGEIPARDIHFRTLDLDSDRAATELNNWFSRSLRRTPAFVLLEGVSYYLNSGALLRIASTFAQLLVHGSVFAFDFWRPELLEHPVFQRLQRYFATRFGFKSADYCLIDDAFIKSVPGYTVHEITDVGVMEPIYAGSRILADKRRILPEYYAELTKE